MKLQGGVKKQARRQAAYERLVKQLQSGFKNEYDPEYRENLKVQLTKSDIKRIKREITILELRGCFIPETNTNIKSFKLRNYA